MTKEEIGLGKKIIVCPKCKTEIEVELDIQIDQILPEIINASQKLNPNKKINDKS